VRIGPSAIDMITGSNAAFGILVALRERDRSGKGQLVDTSLYESALHMMTHMIVDYTGTGKLSGRTGPYFPFLAPYGIFSAQDREFYIGVANQNMWSRICTAMNIEHLVDDPRFRTNRDRAGNQRALYDILEPIFREKPAQHWVAIAEECDIPTSLIFGLDEVVEQKQALARDAIIPVGGGHDKIRSAGIPIKLSETPGKIRNPPPSLAADAVMTEIGLKPSEISALRATKAIK
jgi:crotonobetainyl-CoA:carnitine CoA-transferase CaiB-like acyl-CoA transferase